MGSTMTEKKVIIELTELLKKNSEKVLSGETKLCLTTSSLSILASNFRRYSESTTDKDEAALDTSRKKRKGKPEDDERVWKESLRTLIDFVIKVKALKVIMGSNTMKSPIQINRFRSLQVLEVKKVPIHMLEGLSKLRGQLKQITVSKSLQTLKDLLEICGGDRTPGLVWSNLRVVYLGFNLLQKLDQSLCFIPFAEVIDLSHNSITSTDDFLMNLTDVVRINFGYNLLKSIPQFSTGNISKLKTLVLRNNNLETIDGVEMLAGLEELDLAENFLIDHKVLLPLSKLKKLQVLCLTGNPLSFKDNHRLLTLKYICAQAGKNGFLLDGKKLTAQETLAVSQNQFRIEREYEREEETDGPNVDPNQDDTVLVSHLSPHGKKKKKGHRRKRSMERVPKITDVQDSMTEEVVQPSGATPSTSQIEETDRASQIQEDEEYFKTIREHYKEDWLKVLTGSQNNGQDETIQADTSPGSVVNGDEKKSDQENNSTSENKTLSVEINSIDRGEKRTVVEEEVIKPVRQESVSATSPSVEITATTDIYALSVCKPNTRKEDRPLFYPQHSAESLASPNEEEVEQYGPESEPFIVMLPDKEMKQLFVTVNTRFLNEKDINGTKLDKLDLKYLQKIRSGEEKLYSKDIVDGYVFTILTMNFDYTRKDLRQRRYAMESREEAEHFESLINHHVKSQAGNQEQMECLKCQHEFIVGRENSESKGFTRCPKCDSKLVIKISKPQIKITEEESVTMETDNQDATKKKLSRSRFGGSPLRRSVKHSNQVSDKEDNSGSGGESQGYDSGRAIEIQKRTRLNDKFSSGNSLKDYVDQLIPDDDKPDEVSEQTTSEETGLKKNLSSSELKKSSPGQTRDSFTSVESDIAVLVTNFSAISETGKSNSWLDDSAETNDQSEDSANNTRDNLASGTSILKDLVTPVGSPLSTIVCLSMVSSVYKNTLSSNGESSDVNDSKTDEKSSFEDDLIATPIVKRRSRKSDRKSKHREVTMYDSVTKSDQADTSDDSSTIAKDISDVSKENDISDVSKENESFSQEKNNSEDEITIPSIYDTATSDPDLDRTDSKFESLDSSNQNTTGKSGDLLSPDQMSGSHSSPLRRRGSSRSRSNSRNRSAIYIDSSVQDTSPEDQTSASNILEFPSELSPIKRTGSRRSRKNNRSAVFVDKNSEISDNLSTAMSSTSNEESATTNETSVAAETSSASLQLPWEQASSQSGDGSGRHKHESLIHDEFINIDHSIKLYLELQVFKADETAQCAIQCNIVQYMHPQKIKSLLVISTHKIMIFRYQGKSNDSDWLKCYEDQPISELQYIDIGLGYQTLRLEFGTVCSSFTLLIADEGRCKQFFTLISDIVQKEADAGHSQLQRITKSNPDTLENLTRDVLSENDGESQALVRYLMVRYQGGENDTDETKLMSLAVTESDIVLVDENHQWPLPRLQASLSEDIKGRQFTVVQREKINNIESLMFNEYNHAELRLTFFEKSSAEANSEWIISFETIKGVKLFVDAIRQPWEEEFGISLDIKSTSFSDVDNSSTTQPE